MPSTSREPATPPISRRTFCALVGSGAAFAACLGESTTGPDGETVPRLAVRPASPTRSTEPGLYRIHQDAWSSLLLIPQMYDSAAPMPLVVALHGAGATADAAVNFLGPYAEASGFLLLAPESAGGTWDGVEGIYGPDIATIDAALQETFDRCAVDARRVTLEGFSDGASYALGVGITNPEVFTRIAALSPGFITPSRRQPAKPRVFISHGVNDRVLPIDNASRVIVPFLVSEGYDVTYVEFDGTHTVPPDIAAAAVQFMVAP